MELTPLTAVSSVDGRYAKHSSPLREFCSEYALMRYRVITEVEWFRALMHELPELSPLDTPTNQFLDNLVTQFNVNDAEQVKAIEAKTNHDVKAIEYFLRECFTAIPTLKLHSEYLHFACTSEDINNIAYAMMLRDVRSKLIAPNLRTISQELKRRAGKFSGIAMLARTHGQAASPTSVGKEFANVAARLERQIEQLENQTFLAKNNGAVGNYNAHRVAYPEVDWAALSERFIQHLGLWWNPYTTQIEPHDYMAELFDTISRINTILIDFCRDAWSYISLAYFREKVKADEVGSSTMPHKINPIDFENAEGNLGIANALFGHLSAKLPISRWQRDLSDSTVLRTLGTAFAHTLIAYRSLLRGLEKLEIDTEAIDSDLKERWEVLAEAIQTVMRRYAIPEPYEKLKALTRGQRINRENLHTFITDLEIPHQEKRRLLDLTPSNYVGDAIHLANEIGKTTSR